VRAGVRTRARQFHFEEKKKNFQKISKKVKIGMQ